MEYQPGITRARINSRSGEIEYTFDGIIKDGGTDPATALNFLLASTDDAYWLSPRATAEATQLGGRGNVWNCVTTYKLESPNSSTDPPTGSLVYESDTTGGTAHISTSLETVSSYAASGSAPDLKQLIGVQSDGDPQGVDIIVPAFKFSITKYISWANWTQALEDAIANATGKVNEGSFTVPVHHDDTGTTTRTYPDGECLFLGAQTSERQDKNDLAVKYQFIRSPAASGITIGDIVGIAKKGHEYLWVAYKKSQDATTNEHKSVPEYCYIEKVYDVANLNGLV